MSLFGRWFQQGIRDFEVQIEQNGEWKTIRAYHGSEAFVSVMDIDPVTTSKIRVWVTACNGMGDYSRITEIEAYGPNN